jgi:hypothetical protein
MKRVVLCGTVLALILTLAWASLGQGDLEGTWQGRGMNCYGSHGVAIVRLTLTWQDGSYEMSVDVYGLTGTPVFQATGVAYAAGDVLVCLFGDGESVRTDVLVYDADEDTLAPQWSAVSHDGEVTEAELSLVGTYSRVPASDDS